MKNFGYKSRNLLSVGPHLIGLFFIAAGLIALASPMFLRNEGSLEKPLIVGAGAILLGLLIASAYTGILINFQEKKVKHYTAFLGFSVGQWTELPTIKLVKVVALSYYASNLPNGVSPTFSGKTTDFKVLLYTEDLRPFLSFVYHTKEQAIKSGSVLSENLKAVLDLRVKKVA